MERIAVLLDKAESAHFDAYCHAKGYKKSPLIARLIREHLEREGFSYQPELLGVTASKSSDARPDARRIRRGEAKTDERN